MKVYEFDYLHYIHCRVMNSDGNNPNSKRIPDKRLMFGNYRFASF